MPPRSKPSHNAYMAYASQVRRTRAWAAYGSSLSVPLQGKVLGALYRSAGPNAQAPADNASFAAKLRALASKAATFTSKAAKLKTTGAVVGLSGGMLLFQSVRDAIQNNPKKTGAALLAAITAAVLRDAKKLPKLLQFLKENVLGGQSGGGSSQASSATFEDSSVPLLVGDTGGTGPPTAAAATVDSSVADRAQGALDAAPPDSLQYSIIAMFLSMLGTVLNTMKRMTRITSRHTAQVTHAPSSAST